MLIWLKNEQKEIINVHFMQRVSLKMSIAGLTHWLLHWIVRDPPQISWCFLEIFQSERKHKNKPYVQ